MNSFFNAQFNYCPLIWMLHTRCNNNKIKHLHERCLRLTYCDKKSSYEELNFRHRSDFIVPFARTVYHGTKTISYLGPKIWDIVPSELKKAQSLNSFKKSIRKWAPDNCPCRLCKRFVNGVGFM